MLNNKRCHVAEAKNGKFLQSLILPKSKKGQIAETVTWVVATIIIIVTLIIFIFLSTSISKAKVLTISGGTNSVEKFFLSKDAGEISRLNIKTIFAFSLNSNNQEKINGWIENEK
jgi:preprotein translocase subunit SecG